MCARAPSGSITNCEGALAYFASSVARGISGSLKYQNATVSRITTIPVPIRTFRVAPESL